MRPVLAMLPILTASLAFATNGRAGGVLFGPFDVPTVFFIAKSDDRNRVDYGLKLDERCGPLSRDPVFPYWREFEHAPPVRTHPLSSLEWIPYGIAEQRVTQRGPTGSMMIIKLKQVSRPISIAIRKEGSGRCVATATMIIAGSEAELVSVYVKLAGVLAVDYIRVIGKNLATGQPIEERM